MATRSNIVIGNFNGCHKVSNLEKKENFILFNMWDSEIENLGNMLKAFLTCGTTRKIISTDNIGNFTSWLLTYLKTDYLKLIQKERKFIEGAIPNDIYDILNYDVFIRDCFLTSQIIRGIQYLYVFDFDTNLLYMYCVYIWDEDYFEEIELIETISIY